jgi:hypothetical protein
MPCAAKWRRTFGAAVAGTMSRSLLPGTAARILAQAAMQPGLIL